MCRVPTIRFLSALAATLLAGAVLLGGCGGEPASEGRIVLIGVDGLCWETLNRWEAAEDNADYAWFRENAYVGPLQTIMPTKSPIIWTSVATGARPEDHGVVGFLSRVREFYEAFGGQTPISSLEVRRYPFWEIIKERPSYVVGWWATWPALPLNGVMVTDKFYFWRDMMKHGESCGPATQIVYPPEIESDLTALRRGPDSVTVQEIQRFLDVPADVAAQMAKDRERLVKGETLQRIEHEFPLLYSMDETYYAVAETLLATGADDGIFAIYIRGPDIMGHATMFCSKLYEDTAATPQDRELYGEALTRYYAYTFAQLRKLVDLAGEDALVIIASDHGFERPPEDWVRWGHGHKPDGTIIALGGGIPAPGEAVPAHIYDLAPTVLWLAGHEAAGDMPGHPLTGLFPEVRREVLPRRATYGVRSVELPDATLGPQAGDEQMVELLRSLGYIE